MSLPTLEVIIPVYNEETNIRDLIQGVYKQHQKNYRLREVKVISDQSTDQTEQIVKSLYEHFPTLVLTRNRKRLGKYYTLAYAFSRTNSDFVIALDGDITLRGQRVFDRLVSIMTKSKSLQLVSANESEYYPRDFEGRLVYSAFSAWDKVRLTLPDNNAWHYHGSACLYRGSFVQSLQFPRGLLDPHLYIFLQAQKMGGSRLCRSAYIDKLPISTMHDYFKFMRRSIGKVDPLLTRMYGDLPSTIYKVPLRNKLLGFWHEVASQPFYGPLGIILSFYMSRYARAHANTTPVWDIVTSTKKARA